jgi:hypothetical protein
VNSLEILACLRLPSRAAPPELFPTALPLELQKSHLLKKNRGCSSAFACLKNQFIRNFASYPVLIKRFTTYDNLVYLISLITYLRKGSQSSFTGIVIFGL